MGGGPVTTAGRTATPSRWFRPASASIEEVPAANSTASAATTRRASRLAALVIGGAAIGFACGPGPLTPGHGSTTSDGEANDPPEPTPIPSCPDRDLGRKFPVHTTVFTEASTSRMSGACGADGQEVALRWVAPATATYRFHTGSDNFDPVLSLREETCEGVEIACNDDFITSSPSIEHELLEGEEVIVIVDSQGQAGKARLHIDEADRGVCPDDRLASAYPQTISGTTIDGGNDFESDCGGSVSPDRSYTFVAPEDGTYSFLALGDLAGDGFSPIVSSFSGTCTTDLLDCAVETVGTTVIPRAQLLASLEAGEPMTVVVDGWGATRGEFVLDVDLYFEPPVCPTFEIDSVANFSTEDSTLGARHSFEASCSYTGQGPEHSYRWTAPVDGRYTIHTRGSEIDTALYVRDGDCFGPELACSDDIFTLGPPPAWDLDSEVDVELEGGQTVIIFVDKWSWFDATGGPYKLEINLN